MASVPSSPHLYPMNLEHSLLIAASPQVSSVDAADMLKRNEICAKLEEVIEGKRGLDSQKTRR